MQLLPLASVLLSVSSQWAASAVGAIGALDDCNPAAEGSVLLAVQTHNITSVLASQEERGSASGAGDTYKRPRRGPQASLSPALQSYVQRSPDPLEKEDEKEKKNETQSEAESGANEQQSETKNEAESGANEQQKECLLDWRFDCNNSHWARITDSASNRYWALEEGEVCGDPKVKSDLLVRKFKSPPTNASVCQCAENATGQIECQLEPSIEVVDSSHRQECLLDGFECKNSHWARTTDRVSNSYWALEEGEVCEDPTLWLSRKSWKSAPFATKPSLCQCAENATGQIECQLEPSIEAEKKATSSDGFGDFINAYGGEAESGPANPAAHAFALGLVGVGLCCCCVCLPQLIGYCIYTRVSAGGQKTTVGPLSIILCLCCGCFITLCFPVDKDVSAVAQSAPPAPQTQQQCPQEQYPQQQQQQQQSPQEQYPQQQSW